MHEHLYIAAAAKSLKEMSAGKDDALSRAMLFYAGRISSSIKFILPDYGVILPGWREKPDWFAGIPEAARLPFKEMAIAYSAPEMTEIQEAWDRNGNPVPLSDHMLKKEDTELHSRRVLYVKDIGGKDENKVSITYIGYANCIKKWFLHPMSWVVSYSKINAVPVINYTIPGVDIKKMAHWAAYDYAEESSAVGEIMTALNCRNVQMDTDRPQPVSARFLKSQSKKNRLPIYEHKTLFLKRENPTQKNAGHSFKTSPRCHLRRGHIRRIQDGRQLWINACVVGDKKSGMIDKKYSLQEY